MKNNKLSNLEWVTHSENYAHAIDSGLIDVEKKRQINSKIGKATIKNICGWNRRKVKNVLTGVEYESITKASQDINHSRRSLQDKVTGKRFNDTAIILI